MRWTQWAAATAVVTISMTAPGFLTSAQAQEQPGARASVGEIIITARKREESIQDVPVAVTAFSAEQFADQTNRDISDLSGLAPSVVIDPLGGIPGGAAISIRGIGTFEIEKTNEPSVGVTLDGVFIGSNTNALLNAFDVERLEILRGPQGVLFGRNTTAGMINVVRTRPERDQDLDVRASVTLGSYEQTDVRAMALIPLGDHAGLKLSGYAFEDEGVYNNTFLGRDAGGRDLWSGLVGLALYPTEGLDIWIAYERFEDTSDLGAVRNLATPGLGLSCDIFGDCFTGSTTDDSLRNIESDRVPFNEAILDALTVEANLDLGPGVLTFIYGSRESDELRITDADGTRFPILWFERDQIEEQTSYELRYNTNVLPRTNLTMGGYYFEQTIENTTRNRDLFPFLGALGATAPLTFSPDFFTGSNQVQDTEAWAVFAAADIDLTDRLTLNLGGRFSNEEKTFTARDANLANFGGEGTIFVEVAPGVLIPFAGTGFDPPLSGSDSWEEFTPRIGLTYDVSEDLMLYGSYARGFKSGGFNIRFDTTVAGPDATIPAYDPETVDTYEIGFKWDGLERRLRLNGAIYFSDYQDKQEQVIAPNPATGGLTSITIISNASSVSAFGAELEAAAVLTDNLSLTASVGYNNIEYDDFLADIDRDFDPTTTTVTQNDDLELVRAPEWTASVALDYTRMVGPGEFSANASYRWVDDYFLDVRNDPRGLVEAFGTLDARLGYALEHAGGVAEVSVFGRNITDETRLTSFFQIATVAALGGVNRPQTFGVEFRLSY